MAATIHETTALITGEIRSSDLPELFRIDTATGRVWRFTTVNIAGRGSQGWKLIDEQFNADLFVLTNFPAYRK